MTVIAIGSPNAPNGCFPKGSYRFGEWQDVNPVSFCSESPEGILGVGGPCPRASSSSKVVQ